MRPSTVFLAPTMLLACATSALADTPLGWINSSNPSAYTTTQRELEISVAGLAVNDTIDIFNYREDLVAASGRLQGDSGNLSGSRLELNYGVLEDLSIFYRRQQHSMKLDLGTISSVNLLDIDNSLNTNAESAGFKWTFYRANLLNPDNRQIAASLELSAFRNKSDNFDVVLDEIRFENLTIFFRDPQTFSVNAMEDDGWKARLIYSWPLQEFAIGSVWGGYGKGEASSGTTSDVKNATLKRFFEQQFTLEETYLLFGASLNVNITPRLSVSADYEYIRITDSIFERFPLTPAAGLPGFLKLNSSSGVDDNHTVAARIGYWITPKLNLSLTGNLYSNQFIGKLPHYNNALSASFASVPYGFAGLELNYKISGIP